MKPVMGIHWLKWAREWGKLETIITYYYILYTMTTKEGYTTITISKDLKERLQSLKSHPRQSYEEVIKKVLEERGEQDA